MGPFNNSRVYYGRERKQVPPNPRCLRRRTRVLKGWEKCASISPDFFLGEKAGKFFCCFSISPPHSVSGHWKEVRIREWNFRRKTKSISLRWTPCKIPSVCHRVQCWPAAVQTHGAQQGRSTVSVQHFSALYEPEKTLLKQTTGHPMGCCHGGFSLQLDVNAFHDLNAFTFHFDCLVHFREGGLSIQGLI